MPFGQVLILGAVAGLTIYLGLPFAAFRTIKPSAKSVMNGIATGILLFLAIEIVGNVFGSGEDAIHAAIQGTGSAGVAAATVIVIVAGLLVGLLGIPFTEKRLIKPTPAPQDARGGTGTKAVTTVAATATARAISLSIAAGIGLHNFGEGLAIGQSAASGAFSLALVLIIGFGLHNMTEGFGVAAPLAGTRPSVQFLAGAGLIAGGPTFVGTLVGSVWHAPIASAVFLSLAGGSLVYVTFELSGMLRKTLSKTAALGSVGAGLLVGYLTEMIVGLATGT